MESSQGTPQEIKKRTAEDAFSPPALKQPEKIRKKMEITEEHWGKIMEAFDNINSMKNTMESIREELAPLRKAVEDVENRVKRLEEEHVATSKTKERIVEYEREVEQVKSDTQQIKLNNYLIVRHFPLKLKEDKNELNRTINRLFNILQLDIQTMDYETTAFKVRNKDLSFVQIKFATQMMKAKVLNKFRQTRKNSDDNIQLLVENLTGLPTNHQLNGQLITMQNKLTRSNVELLKAARIHTRKSSSEPGVFDFVYDDAEGKIIAKRGDEFIKIDSLKDIEDLVAKYQHFDSQNENSHLPTTRQERKSERATRRGIANRR